VSDTVRIHVTEEDAGERADRFVTAHLPDVSRSAVQLLFREGHVCLNGTPGKPATRVASGDVLDVEIVPRPPLTVEPCAMPLMVIYQDGDLAVIDKPAGLVVHPAPGNQTGTLANILAALFPQARDVGSQLRPGIVHRLDKETSGLMVVALNSPAHASLQIQISSRTAERRYLALVEGRLTPEYGEIDAPIGRHRTRRTLMAPHGQASRPARTSYRVVEYLPGATFLEARLHTGRTHQIRVHFSALRHPVAGDTTYGGRPIPGLHRHFLHAHRLAFDSPSTGERLEFESTLPADLQAVLDRLRVQLRDH
jgi:23S rRNA pseudouridine1911/1915/1917 synthase